MPLALYATLPVLAASASQLIINFSHLRRDDGRFISISLIIDADDGLIFHTRVDLMLLAIISLSLARV